MDNPSDPLNRHVQGLVLLGEKHSNRYQRLALDTAPLTSCLGHVFRSYEQIPVTNGDIQQVNEDIPDIDSPGARWVHEKTIYAQPNPQQVTDLGLTQRILQLFAHVAEDGTVLRVNHICSH
jgi:hypothetical protein